MLRNLLILLIIASGTTAIAQPRTEVKQPEATKPAAPATPAIDYKIPGAPMPSLLMETYIDSSRLKGSVNEKSAKKHEYQQFVTDKDLDNHANLFVMMFNPTCSHCQDETQMLEKNIGLFNKSKIVLLANKYMKTYMPNFISSMKTEDYPQMVVGTDTTDFINNVFLYSALPQINIYDKKRKLIKSFTGETPLDSLKAYIQ